MRLKSFISSLALVLFLGACGGAFSVPVAVKTSKGQTLHGTAVATVKAGTFEVKNDKGLSCSGTYDPQSMERTMVVSLDCSDGRRGTANIQRDSTLANGIGQGKFNDGTKFEVGFGDYVGSM